jgi:hypothetical protein
MASINAREIGAFGRRFLVEITRGSSTLTLTLFRQAKSDPGNARKIFLSSPDGPGGNAHHDRKPPTRSRKRPATKVDRRA